MNDRQVLALLNPALGGNMDPWRRIRQRGDGSLLVTILAVDR